MKAERRVRAQPYIRESTESQMMGLSPDVQRGAIEQFCKVRGWEMLPPVVEAESATDIEGRDLYRGIMARMDRWDVFVVMKIDRSHRNAREFLDMLDEFKKAGKTFISVYENIDTSTAAGWKFATDMAVDAEYESRRISERVLPSMDLAKDRSLHVGRAPVGTVLVKAKKRFEPLDWALKVKEDALVYGLERAGEMNTYPRHDPPHRIDGKTRSDCAVQGTVENNAM